MELLFERFLSEERGEWPDIDLDLPSGDQRERVKPLLEGDRVRAGDERRTSARGADAVVHRRRG